MYIVTLTRLAIMQAYNLKQYIIHLQKVYRMLILDFCQQSSCRVIAAFIFLCLRISLLNSIKNL